MIDPKAGYMVRSARMYDRSDEKPTISVSNSGLKWFGSLCLPEKTEWEDSYGALRKTSLENRFVSSKPDMEFLERAKATRRRPYPVRTNVIDERMWPPLTLQYRANELFPEGHKGQEEAILFEQFENAPDRTGILSPTSSISSQGEESQGQDVNTEGVKNNEIQTLLGVQDVDQAVYGTKLPVAWIILIGSILLGTLYFIVRFGGRKINDG